MWRAWEWLDIILDYFLILTDRRGEIQFVSFIGGLGQLHTAVECAASSSLCLSLFCLSILCKLPRYWIAPLTFCFRHQVSRGYQGIRCDQFLPKTDTILADPSKCTSIYCITLIHQIIIHCTYFIYLRIISVNFHHRHQFHQIARNDIPGELKVFACVLMLPRALSRSSVCCGSCMGKQRYNLAIE